MGKGIDSVRKELQIGSFYKALPRTCGMGDRPPGLLRQDASKRGRSNAGNRRSGAYVAVDRERPEQVTLFADRLLVWLHQGADLLHEYLYGAPQSRLEPDTDDFSTPPATAGHA